MNNTQRLKKYSLVILLLSLLLVSCSTTNSDDTNDDSTVTVSMSANFSSLSSLTSAVTDDTPGNNSGDDLDNDGGTVRFTTPSQFIVAIHSLSLIQTDGTTVNIIISENTLEEATVVDISSPINLPITTIPDGTYESIYVEFYYYQLTMVMNVPTLDQAIRIYLSDDDFSSEGNLGHHQGDITLIDDSNLELGFVAAGEAWTTPNLVSTRGDIQGAGGSDTETDHKRGLYGNQDLWNQVSFTQGPNQDIYNMTLPLSFTIDSGTSTTISITFPLQDAWYYEDFDDNQVFNPGGSGLEAVSSGASWSPVFQTPVVSVN